MLETDLIKYGLLIRERRFLHRSVFIVDGAGVLRYVASMPTQGTEPNYDAVIAAAKTLL